MVIKFVIEATLGSLETIHVRLYGLGPVNFIARKLVKDLVIHNIR